MSDFSIVDGVLNKYQGNETEIVLPDNVITVGGFAFSECKAVEKIVIPEGTIAINGYAFADCKNLKTLVIPKSVTRIGMVAFRSCWNLTEILMPGVTQLGDDAFYDCRYLEMVYAPLLAFDNSNIQKKKEQALRAFIHHRKDYSDETVVDGYRKYLLSRKKYVLPEIFANDLADTIRDFDYGKKITAKNIDSEFLGPAMSVNATNCVAYLLDWKARNLKEKSAGAKKPQDQIKDPFSAAEMKKVWAYEKDEDGTVILSNYKGVDTKIDIPARIGNDSVTSIGEYAFSPQRSRRPSKQAEVLNKVDKVTIPSNIKRIGNGAFYMCWGLKEVFVSYGVESIGNDAFYACDALKKITIPASVKEIGKDAFTHCFNLSIVAEEGTYAQTYAKENDIPFCIL